MFDDINVISITGRTCKPIEIKQIGQDNCVGKFSVACNKSVKSKDGKWTQKPSFFNITCWGVLAKTAAKFMPKGSVVSITGRLEQQTWEDKTSGEKKSSIEIVASDIKFPNKPKASGGDVSGNDSGDSGGNLDDFPF